MSDISNFQIAVIGIIIGLVFLAVLVFSGVLPGFRDTGSPVPLTMWGFLPKEKLAAIIELVNKDNKKSFSLSYVEKNKEIYEEELVNALAGGTGPDIFLLTQDLILKHGQKTYLILFEVFPERTFRDTFADGADIFLRENGMVAAPIMVDPIVMYWNKNIFSAAGLASPPKTWDEFLNCAISFTRKDTPGNILQSGAAMGEFSNIRNAKDIFSMLVLQSGNKIVEPLTLKVSFGEKGSALVEPAGAALNYYTSFSNPSKISYSWNRALPNSRDFFAEGKLAVYFGYAGEYDYIVKQNPHLDFDVAVVPQIKDSLVSATFGKIYALAAAKSSPYVGQAIGAALNFTRKDIMGTLSEDMFLPPLRRDLLSESSANPVMTIFYKAAVQARSWLEPDPAAVSDIFQDMIESVVSGKKNISKAIMDAGILLNKEMEKVRP